MNGSDFVKQYAPKGATAWEAAALELAKSDGLTPWPFVPVTVSDGTNSATLQVMSDVLSIGPTQDFVRMPLTATMAQNVLNLFGWLLPTPELAWQIYFQSGAKVEPHPMVPNQFANLNQYAQHSAIVTQQLAQLGAPGMPLVGGIKKHLVVSNIAKPGMEVIFGWWKLPPAPLVYDDGKPWDAPNRQPIQIRSNAHATGYVDYSHGIQPIGPTAAVNAPGIFVGTMPTEALYKHPVLSKLMSREGPLVQVRYPAAIKPPPSDAVSAASPAALRGPLIVPRRPVIPSLADQGVARAAKITQGGF